MARAHKSGRYPKKHAKQRHESRKRRKGHPPKQHKSGSNRRGLVITLGIVILVALGASAALMYFASGNGSDSCTEILKAMTAGKPQDIKASPPMMHYCRLKSCQFDVTQCDNRCPFSFKSDENTGCPEDCTCASSGIYQGDIQYTEEDLPTMLQAYGHQKEENFEVFFATSHAVWDEDVVDGRKRIPFVIDQNLPKEGAKLWNEAVELFGQKTCVDFIHRTTQDDYILVFSGKGCWASIGRSGGMEQPISFGPSCLQLSTFTHEIMHTLGFPHEHARPDRDTHITILIENADKAELRQFDKIAEGDLINFGSPYDSDSILHYRSRFLSMTGEPTILFKPENEPRWDIPEGPTEEDFREINYVYNCELDTATGTWTDWTAWSDCGVTCGRGPLIRTRDCMDTQGNKITNCEGEGLESMECDAGDCPPGEGRFTEWWAWEACSATCGISSQMRYRSCPEEYADGCHSVLGSQHKQERRACRVAMCDGSPLVPLEPKWQYPWTEMEECDMTCGAGKRKMLLGCLIADMSWPIYNCDPELTDLPASDEVAEFGLYRYEVCNTMPCEGPLTPDQTPVSPEGPPSEEELSVTSAPDESQAPPELPASQSLWSEWGLWGNCDKLCGSGNRVRSRTCLAAFCGEEYFDVETCNEGPCFDDEDKDDRTSMDAGLIPKSIKFQTSMVIPSLCAHGELLTGSFNFDEFEDFLCFHQDGVIKLYFAQGGGKFNPNADWEGKTNMCVKLGEGQYKLYAKDLNGDHMDDLLCRNKVSKELEVLINNDGSFAESINWKGNRNLCRDHNEILNVFDLNGDRRSDLICGDEENAFQKIVFHMK